MPKENKSKKADQIQNMQKIAPSTNEEQKKHLPKQNTKKSDR